MATTPFTAFYPWLEAVVTGCPTSIMTKYLAESAAEFCAQTYIWQVETTEVNTVADTATYTPVVPAETTLEDVLQIKLDAGVIYPTTQRQKELDLDSGKPNSFAIVQGTLVRMYPTPDAVYPWVALLVVKPTLASTGIESFIYETHGRCIANGAIAKLLMHPGKGWSDPGMAPAYKAMFDKAVASERRRAFRSTAQRVQMRPFA